MHNCQEHLREIKATPAKPYYFTWTDLRNVYIHGIKYDRCRVCRKVAASYPAIGQMLAVLTDAVLVKPTALNGEEIRFLRSVTRLSATAFAAAVGVSTEQVSRWENNHNKPRRSADKLIRMLAASSKRITDGETPPAIIDSIHHLQITGRQAKRYILAYDGVWTARCISV